MNGEQARCLQAWMGARPYQWPLWKTRYLNRMSRAEIILFAQLWEEFYPDAGNLYRIPMMIREED